MKIGYARISTPEQCLYSQEDALKNAGCTQIYTDIASGAKDDRPGLNQVLHYLREDDILVVYKLDRLARSMRDLIKIIKDLEEKRIGFQSVHESINTSTSVGKLIFHIFGAIAEFERDLILERTQAGLKSARARGRLGGRPALLNEKEIKRMLELYNEKQTTLTELCKIFKISVPTIYNYIHKYKV